MEKSVLLVDDKQEIAKIIMLYLSSTYKVSYKENPLKAIAWLQEGNLPDLIISDLNMPEMSGEEFLVYLKANDMFSHIPVLILSSVESSSNRIRLFFICRSVIHSMTPVPNALRKRSANGTLLPKKT